MPRTVVTYKIFLASPSDVKEEREIVKKEIETYNRIHSCDNIMLELLCWEDSTYPSFGDYPQDVVNSQIGDDYDVFIGILWARFGTPTLEYKSGTEEEFYRAYERYNNGDDVELMVYRKDESISPSAIDVEQLKKVNSFTSKVADLGGYYFTFTGKEQFHDILLKHLEGVIRDLEKRRNHRRQKTPLATNTGTIERVPVKAGREMWGLFEYSEFIVCTCSEVKANVDRISNLTEKIGMDMQLHTRELNIIHRNSNTLHVKSILINTARDMNKYAEAIDEPNTIWYAKYLEVQQAIKEMIDIAEGFVSEKEGEGLIDNLRDMNSGMGNAYSAMRQLYSAVNRLPKISQPLIIAKLNVCNKVKSIITNLQAGQLYCDETIEYVENRIHPIED